MFAKEILVTNGILFLYFYLKNFLIYKKFKFFKTANLGAATSIVISLITTAFNQFLIDQYSHYENLTFIKGAVNLPPYTLLFITADLFGSIFALLWVKGFKENAGKYKGLIVEFCRMAITFVVFTLIATNVWTNSSTKMVKNYDCFKYSLIKDLAVYYLENGQFPNEIANASNTTTNPLNDSDLIIKKPESPLEVTVEDELGNIIIAGYKDYIGISTYKDNPKLYIDRLEIPVGRYCQLAE